MIRNEQLKLTANYLNGLAIGTFIVGTIGPVISVTYTDNEASWTIIVVAFLCFAISAGLHVAGRLILGGLTDHA